MIGPVLVIAIASCHSAAPSPTGVDNGPMMRIRVANQTPESITLIWHFANKETYPIWLPILSRSSKLPGATLPFPVIGLNNTLYLVFGDLSPAYQDPVIYEFLTPPEYVKVKPGESLGHRFVLALPLQIAGEDPFQDDSIQAFPSVYEFPEDRLAIGWIDRSPEYEKQEVREIRRIVAITSYAIAARGNTKDDDLRKRADVQDRRALREILQGRREPKSYRQHDMQRRELSNILHVNLAINKPKVIYVEKIDGEN